LSVNFRCHPPGAAVFSLSVKIRTPAVKQSCHRRAAPPARSPRKRREIRGSLAVLTSWHGPCSLAFTNLLKGGGNDGNVQKNGEGGHGGFAARGSHDRPAGFRARWLRFGRGREEHDRH